MLTSKKTLGVLLLLLLTGLITLAGHCYLRYLALQRCLASGCVEFENWEGWAVSLESKMLGGRFSAWETPSTAFLPFSRPRVVRVCQVDPSPIAKQVVLSSSQMLELGKDLDLLGLPEELDCYYREGLGQLFTGMGKSSRLSRLVAERGPDFDDQVVSLLSLFPNLRELKLTHSKFSGSGFPPLANLEKVEVHWGEADGRIFPALLACRSLKEVSISGPNVPVQEAEALRALPKIERIYVHSTSRGKDSASNVSNTFDWER